MSNNNEHVDYTEFESWLNEYMPEEDNAKGEKVRVKGILATKERNFSFLDVPGLPTSVRVRTEELENYNEGDEVEVLLVGEDEDFKIGSRRRIDMEDRWKKLEAAFEKKEIITGKIVKRVKGGYMVEAMFHQGFLPNSLSEISMKDGDKVIGEEIKVMIKDIKPDKDKKGKKITFSKKDITLLKESEEFSDFFKSPIHYISGNLLTPLFAMGKYRATLKAKKAAYEQECYSYEKSVLTAFKEARNAIVDFNKIKDIYESRLQLERSSKATMELAQLQYINGVIGYLDVLDAQRSYFDAQIGLSNAIRDKQITLVKLYKALGGGW